MDNWLNKLQDGEQTVRSSAQDLHGLACDLRRVVGGPIVKELDVIIQNLLDAADLIRQGTAEKVNGDYDEGMRQHGAILKALMEGQDVT